MRGLAAQRAAGMAGAMESYRRIVVARPALDAERVDDEVAQFPRALGDGTDFRQIRFFLKFQESAVKHHGRARSGGHDDGSVARERPNRVADDLARSEERRV